MADLKWTIGEVDIFQLVEVEAGKLIQSIIKGATPQNIRQIGWLAPHFDDRDGNLKALVQSFLIKSDNRYVLVDTCNGNTKSRTDIPEWSNLQTDFLNKLNDLGLTEEDIDIVVCTHLHCDHVGWNTKLENGDWVPTFPNAKYLFVKQEYEYWKQRPEKEIADDKNAFDDSVAPIVKAGIAELVDVNHRIDRHISLLPTPGHTPGHISVVIESARERAIISGDVLFHPCQIAHPEWRNDIDTLSDQATETRRKILAEIADTDTLLIGSHFPNPVAGRVVRLDKDYIFET